MSASVGPRGGPRPPTAPPSMPELPDLSHLTEEERKIIMAVMVRQREEEAKEQQAMIKEEKPIQAKTVNLVGNRKPPQQNDISRCNCGQVYQAERFHQTKFADGCGNLCSYCQTKFCARCGGRVSLRSNSVMWVCNKCRKQQDMLTNSGEWFTEQGPKAKPSLKKAMSDPAECADPAGDKKVRSRSQIPLGSSASTAQDNQLNKNKSPAAGQADLPSSRSRSEPPQERKKQSSTSDQNGKPGSRVERRRGLAKIQSQPSQEWEPGDARRETRHLVKARSQERSYTDIKGSVGELRRTEGEQRLLREEQRNDPPHHPVKAQPTEQEKRVHQKAPRLRQGDTGVPERQAGEVLTENRTGRRWAEERQPSLESKQQGIKGERTVGGTTGPAVQAPKPNHTPQPPAPGFRVGPAAPTGTPELREPPERDRKLQPSHLEPGSAGVARKAKREKAESMLRNDSLSSDQSECLRPPPPRPYKSKRGGNKRQMSVSSSEEEGGSTPEYTSCEDGEIESVSERGDWESYSLDPTVWHHPVTWQPSKEGDHLIGRITLSKRTAMPKESGALLGLKVAGGKITETGRLGAFITKVKKGSLADVVGHLRAAGSSSFESQKMERPSISVMSPSSPSGLRDAPQLLPGQLSVKMWYDKVGHQLIVNVLQAKDLPPRPDGRPRNPYVKMYFLPDRSDKSKRRTKTVKKSSEPKWNQTFVYSHVHRRDFREHMLEITVWDQPKVQEEESSFLGEASSQRITESDYDDGIGVVAAAAESRPREKERERGRERERERERERTTLEVPEQQRSTHHRSRSVSPHRETESRARSRPANVPMQRSLDEAQHSRRSRSPTRYHEHGRVQEREYVDDRSTQSLPRIRPTSPRILIQHASPEDDRVHPHASTAYTSSAGTSSSARRGRQLPQVPAKSSSVEQALASEERTRQMKVHSFRTAAPSSTSQDMERALKNKRELYKEQRRSCDNVSHKSSDSDVSDVSAISRASSASRISSTSYMSIQSERPRGHFSRHVHPSSMLKSTSVSGEIFTLERTDGSQSDTALGSLGTGGKKRRSSLSARVVAIVGIPSRRSRSTSQLSQTEAANKKTKGSSQIQRSQETGMAVEYPRNAMARQASRESTDGSMNSYSSEGKSVS
ncbi:regulating synaptic membrane exocytosis protein 2 isoform X1 [Silurus asotus]|uniref:Regulating synaptic membrane exocytosis protein 2 isoform X1 n=1 Tax=Silurus asotus TaxID=30991 RepID=A0AAD5FGR7_SILAS|nr:regulating synaptic membrane exocytosis protein 2 isoform X1 [Silurus asotus]